MFKNPAWTALRGKERRVDDPAHWYGAEDAKRINSLSGGTLYNPDNSAYELGFDFCQIFVFKNHSSGVLGIRSVD
jgi:hypothetical protein